MDYHGFPSAKSMALCNALADWNGNDGENETNVILGKNLLVMIHNTIFKLNEEYNKNLCETEVDVIGKEFDRKKMEAIEQAKQKKFSQEERLNTCTECFNCILENQSLIDGFTNFLGFPFREPNETPSMKKIIEFMQKKNKLVEKEEEIDKKIEEIDRNFDQQTDYKKTRRQIRNELLNRRFELQIDIDDGLLNLSKINKNMIKLTTVDTTNRGRKRKRSRDRDRVKR